MFPIYLLVHNLDSVKYKKIIRRTHGPQSKEHTPNTSQRDTHSERNSNGDRDSNSERDNHLERDNHVERDKKETLIVKENFIGTKNTENNYLRLHSFWTLSMRECV